MVGGLMLMVKEATVAEIQALQHQPQADFIEAFISGERSRLDLDKAWHGIHFLLTGKTYEGEGPEAYLVMGGTSLGDLHEEFGPARALSADEIKQLHNVMTDLSMEDLQERYDPEHMVDIYPGFWDPDYYGEDFSYLMFYFERLKDFLGRLAAQDKGAILLIH